MLIGILITEFLITFMILHSGMDVIFSSYFIKLLFALKKKDIMWPQSIVIHDLLIQMNKN